MDVLNILGSVVIPAAVSLIVALMARHSNRTRIAADTHIAERKLQAETELAERRFAYEQKADGWQRRYACYRELLDRLPALTKGQTDQVQINELLREVRRLWLFASVRTVRATNEFIESIEKGKMGSESSEQKLGALIVALRRDLTNAAPEASGDTDLSEADFRLKSAS